MKKSIFLTVILILSFCLSFNCFASVSTEYNHKELTTALPAQATVKNETELSLNSESAILMDSATKTVLYEKNSNQKTAPASITKIMTLLLVMEALDEGKINLETVVTADEYSCSMGGSQIWLKVGEQMTVDHLLKATGIASANDAAVTLGTAICGNNTAFVQKMNAKAKELGLKNTNFENATGLDSDNHYSSAYDIAVMSAHLLKYPLIKKYSTVWMDTLRDGQSELVNTNKLVKFYSGCTGLKTGTTSKAGSCLSASAERDGMELIAVVMKAPDSKTRFNEARSLLDYGFASFQNVKVTVDKTKLTPVKVKNGFESSVSAVPKNETYILIGKGKENEIEQKIVLNGTVTAPVKKGQVLGRAEIYYKNNLISSIDLISNANVTGLTLGNCFKRLFYL